jgi:signal transduction histidine kinase
MHLSPSTRCHLALAALLLAACDDASQLRSWNPLASVHETRQLRTLINQQENQLLGLPEARTVAQSHQRIGFHGRAAAPARITLDLGRQVTPDEVVLFAARIADPAPDDPIGGFPGEVRVLLADHPDPAAFRLIAQWKESAPGQAGDLPWLRIPIPDATGRFLRLELQSQHLRGRTGFFTLGEIVVLENGMNRALGAEVKASQGIDNAPRWSAANLTDGFLWCGNLHGTARASSNGFHSQIESQADAVPKWVEVDLGQTYAMEEVRLVPARPADFADVTGFGFPPAFQVLLDPPEAQSTAPVIPLFATGPSDFPNPGDAAVCLNAAGHRARRVRIQADQLWHRSGDYIFALAELQVFSGGENVALGQTVRFSDVVEKAASWQPAALVDGFASQRELLPWAAWLAGVSQRLELQQSLALARIKLAQREAQTQKDLLRAALALVIASVLIAAALIFHLQRRQLQARQKLRECIARDLHDEIGSQLSHLALLAESGDQDALPTIATGARELQLAMRDLVWLLDPGSGDARDFSNRLRATCRQLLAPTIREVVIESDGNPPAIRLPLAWSREVLLFIREATTNAARHSHATAARLRFDWSPTTFCWELRDNGRGFDESAPSFSVGAGLRNLRHRAHTLKADLTIESRPAHGTWIRLHCSLPQGT